MWQIDNSDIFGQIKNKDKLIYNNKPHPSQKREQQFERRLKGKPNNIADRLWVTTECIPLL